MEVEVGAEPHDGYSVQASSGFLDQALQASARSILEKPYPPLSFRIKSSGRGIG